MEKVFINLNDELGSDFFSVESLDNEGYWLDSFHTLDEALDYIRNNNLLYDPITGFKDTRHKEYV